MSTLYDGQGHIINIDNGDMSLSVRKLLSFDDWPEYNGYIATSTGKWSNVNNNYKVRVITVSGGETITISGEQNGKVSVVKSFSDPVSGADAPTLATGMSYNALFTTLSGTTLPSDARYIIIQTVYGGVDWSPSILKLNGLDYMSSVREEITELHYLNGVKWVQFGDSITSGYYSYFDENDDNKGKSGTDMTAVWPYLVSQINKWDYTNMGVGGVGWIEPASHADAVAFKQVRKILDWSEYNLVTFAYGINDWKGDWAEEFGSITDEYTYSENMTPTTVVNSMRYCFDYIMSKNPAIKIIVITPFNCRGYESQRYGTYETCWARGYTREGLTLDNFADLMVSVCNEYGVEYIDGTRLTCINRANMIEILPDGVHPSKDCHKILAREMAKKISFS